MHLSILRGAKLLHLSNVWVAFLLLAGNIGVASDCYDKQLPNYILPQDTEDGSTVDYPMYHKGGFYKPRKQVTDWWGVGQKITVNEPQTNVPAPYNHDGFKVGESSTFYNFDKSQITGSDSAYDLQVLFKEFTDDFQFFSAAKPWNKLTYQWETAEVPTLKVKAVAGEVIYVNFVVAGKAAVEKFSMDAFGGAPLKTDNDRFGDTDGCAEANLVVRSWQRPAAASGIFANWNTPTSWATKPQVSNRWLMPMDLWKPQAVLGLGEFREFVVKVRVPEEAVKGATYKGKIRLKGFTQNRWASRSIELELSVLPFSTKGDDLVAKKHLGMFYEVPKHALKGAYKTGAQLTNDVAKDRSYAPTRRMLTELYDVRASGHESILVANQDMEDLGALFKVSATGVIDFESAKTMVRYLCDVGFKGTVVLDGTQIWYKLYDNAGRKNLTTILGNRDGTGREDSVSPQGTAQASLASLFTFLSDGVGGYKSLCQSAPFRLAIELQDEVEMLDHGYPADTAMKRFQDWAYQIRKWEKANGGARVYTYSHATTAPNTVGDGDRQGMQNYLKNTDAHMYYFPKPDSSTQVRSRKYLDIRSNAPITDTWYWYPLGVEKYWSGSQWPRPIKASVPNELGRVSPVFDGFLNFYGDRAQYGQEDERWSYAWSGQPLLLGPTWYRVQAGAMHWASDDRVHNQLGWGKRPYTHGSAFVSVDNDCAPTYAPVQSDPAVQFVPEACDAGDGSDNQLAGYGYEDAPNQILHTRNLEARKMASQDLGYLTLLEMRVGGCDGSNLASACGRAKRFLVGIKKFMRGEEVFEDLSAPGVLPGGCTEVPNVLGKLPARVDGLLLDDYSDIYGYVYGADLPTGTRVGRLVYPGTSGTTGLGLTQMLGRGVGYRCLMDHVKTHIEAVGACMGR